MKRTVLDCATLLLDLYDADRNYTAPRTPEGYFAGSQMEDLGLVKCSTTSDGDDLYRLTFYGSTFVQQMTTTMTRSDELLDWAPKRSAGNAPPPVLKVFFDQLAQALFTLHKQRHPPERWRVDENSPGVTHAETRTVPL